MMLLVLKMTDVPAEKKKRRLIKLTPNLLNILSRKNFRDKKQMDLLEYIDKRLKEK